MGAPILIAPTHECATCAMPIQLNGGSWIDTQRRLWCTDTTQHAPAVIPPQPSAEWDNGIPITEQLQKRFEEKMHATTEKAKFTQAIRDSLGLGMFDPLLGNQMLENCTVSWVDAEGTHEELGCTVTVYGAAVMVDTRDGRRFHERLCSPMFGIRR